MLFIRIYYAWRMIAIYKTRFREFIHIRYGARNESSYRIKIRSPADP